MLKIFDWLRGRSADNETATEIYGSIVAQARQPVFYERFGVADVAEKRYEMIVLHVVLLLEPLRAGGSEGMASAQAVVELFVSDLDGSIREMAVSDNKVPAKVRKAAGGLYDRDELYRQAFEGGGPEGAEAMTVADLIAELIFDGNATAGSRALTGYALASREKLGGWLPDGGGVRPPFPDPYAFFGEQA